MFTVYQTTAGSDYDPCRLQNPNGPFPSMDNLIDLGCVQREFNSQGRVAPRREDAEGGTQVPILAGDSITGAIRNRMKMPSNCLRYRYLKPFIESFNELCGACLDDNIKYLQTLINLWCLRGSPGKASKSFCEAQYTIMKPACDLCDKCTKVRRPTPRQCSVARKSQICWIFCTSWYDNVCPQGKPPKVNPVRHKTKNRKYEENSAEL